MPKISEGRYNIDLWTKALSAGVIGTAPTFTDNDDGTYDLSEFDVLLYDNANHEGGLKQFTIAASAGRSLASTVNEVSYCVVKYNAGTPILVDLTSAQLSQINESDVIPIFTLLNDNNVHIHVLRWDTLGQGLANMTHKRIVKTDRIKRESGAVLSTGAGADHHMELTSARYWLGSVEHDLDAIDTSSAQGDIVSYDGNSGTGATFAIWGINDPPLNGGAVHLQVKSGGSGYASNGTNVAVTGGSGTGLTINYHQVGGVIVSAEVNQEGINYETTSSLYFYHYTGTGLTTTITVANGVVDTISAFTDNTTGTLTDGTYTNLATTGAGTGLTVDVVVVSNAIDAVYINAHGSGYTASDAIQVAGTLITGGTGGTVDFTVSTITDGVVTGATIGAAGTRYYAGDIIEITGGGGAGATIRIDTVGASRAVTAITLISGGSGYTAGTVATYAGWTYKQYAAQDGVYPNNGYDTTTGIVDTTSNDWVVAWVYRDLEPEPHFGYVLGTEAYGSFAEASASQPRSDLPNSFGVMASLVGRIICKDGQNVDAGSPNTGVVENAFGQEYTGTPVTSHNSLANLQGGTGSEYYHLTAAEYGYVNTPEPEGLGADYLHGIGDVATTLAFDNTTHVFTISGTNWFYVYQGVRVDIATSATIDLDTAGVGFPAVGLYFIYFDDATGVLTASTTPWDLEVHVPVSLLYWNSATGTGTGAITDERHGYRRDLQWHSWAHSSLNTRYISGLGLTLPSAVTPNQIDIASGVIADEDIRHAIANTTNSRIWRETAADVWTFTDDTLPYYDTTTGTGGSPEWPHSGSSYTPTALTAGHYMPVFCYGSGDQSRPIYIVVPSMSASDLYPTVSASREHPVPAPSFAAELKLLYRFIFDDAGDFYYDASQDDYRLAVGKVGSESGAVTAATTTFSPYDNISATNVQAALEEINDEQKIVNINARTTTAYELVLADAGKLVTRENSSASTLTIPANSSVAFPTGTTIDVLNIGTGTVTIGITTDTLNGITDLDEGASAVLVKVGATTWWSFGGASGASGATISDDTSTDASYYPTMNSATSGDFTTATISSTKLYFNPSTGTLNSTVFNTLSDIYYKENIHIVENATATVKQLSGVGFNWKDNGNKSYGVIAQQVETVIPELVSGDEIKSVNYDGLIAFLINAIKEMDERIQELENK